MGRARVRAEATGSDGKHCVCVCWRVCVCVGETKDPWPHGDIYISNYLCEAHIISHSAMAQKKESNHHSISDLLVPFGALVF